VLVSGSVIVVYLPAARFTVVEVGSVSVRNRDPPFRIEPLVVTPAGSPPMADSESTLMESYTEMTEILLPNDTNNLGRALGGVVLHWMDICGAIAAMRFSNRQCVTAAMDHVDFISPIDQGEVVAVEAYVFETGRTSLEVKVDVRAENPRTGEERETTTSFLTFVALDETGTPTGVPGLACPTDAQRELRTNAREKRREQLKAVADRL
jgi:acyl-CoA hydrolase